MASIDPAGDLDLYTFSANAGDSILVAVTPASGNLYPDVSLYGPDGNELASAWCDYARRPIEISRVLPEDGHYTILVRDHYGFGRTGSYGIVGEILNDPGNTVRPAPGETVLASIDPAGDLDLYTFSANAGDSILVAVTPASGNLYPDVSLYGPDGNELASAWCDYARRPIEISRVLPEDGHYTILVREAGGSGGKGNYELSLNKQVLEQLTLGDPCTAVISAGIWHRYYVEVEADKKLLVTLEPNSPTAVLELYSRYGQLPDKAQSDWTSKVKTTLGNYEILISPTNSGTYYVGLYGATVEGSIEYTITAALADRHISDVYPRMATNSTSVSVHVLGLGFATGMQVELESRAKIVPAGAVVLSSPQMMIAQFDLETAPLGEYDITIIWPDGTELNIENAIDVRPLPVGTLYSSELDMTAGEVIEVPIVVLDGSDNLFVTIQGTSANNWFSLAIKHSEQQIASDSRLHDFILHVTEPAAGAYTIELTARQTGKGILTVWDKLPELPMGQWIIGRIYGNNGSTWYQVEIPPGQETFYLEAEAMGWWSHFDIYYGQYGSPTRWVSQNGTETSIEIPEPEAGTYIVQFTDSAWLRIGDRMIEDLSRDVMIKANTTFTVEPPLNYLPTITSLSTDKGGNTGLVTVEIKGGWLDPNATVALVHQDYGEVFAHSVFGDLNGTSLAATFDLTGKDPGQYTLIVINPDGHQVYAPTEFTIEQGGEPELWVEIVGRDKIRVGRETTYVVRFGNSGQIDAPYPYLAVALPKSVSYDVDLPWSIPPSELAMPSDEDAVHVTLVDLPYLPPHSAYSLSITISLPRVENSEFYTLKATVTQDPTPYFKSLLLLSDGLLSNSSLSVQSLRTDFTHENDRTDNPPAGYIMIWKYKASGAFHIAKSIGDIDNDEKAEFIEMFNDGLKIQDVEKFNDKTQGYAGAFRTPMHDTDPHHGDDVRRRALELIDKYDDKDEYTSGLCENEISDDKFKTNCLGTVHYLNPELYQEHGLILQDKIYDWLKTDEDPKWDDLERGDAWVEPQASKMVGYMSETTCPSPEEWVEKTLGGVDSATPEDKYGHDGFDLSDTPPVERKRFISSEREMYYKVDFWNKEDATAPACDVLVIDRLDPNLDAESFRFEEIGFRKWNVKLEPCQYFNVNIDIRPDVDLVVNVEGTFDQQRRELTWTFRSLDPVTWQMPDDPMAGFLPPITDSGEEVGWVAFTVEAKDGLETGAKIRNQAFVEFDWAGDILDHPAPKEGPWVNTIDAGEPNSHVLALAGTTSATTFTVQWVGQDDPGGSGIAGYDIYVSTDGSPYELWLDDTNHTSAEFTTDPNAHTYAFYSVARDNVGHVENAPVEPDAVTTTAEPLRVGDISGDGEVTTYDAVLAAQCAEGSTVLSPAQRMAADVTGDGCVSDCDAMLIARYAVGLNDSFPAEQARRLPGQTPICGCLFYGDINRDSKITIQDVLMTINCTLCIGELSDVQRIAADVDGNGWITIEDVALMIMYVSDEMVCFPADEKVRAHDHVPVCGYGYGDFDGSCTLDFTDLALFAESWMRTECGICDAADFTGDGTVDWRDLSVLADNWLKVPE